MERRAVHSWLCPPQLRSQCPVPPLPSAAPAVDLVSEHRGFPVIHC